VENNILIKGDYERMKNILLISNEYYTPYSKYNTPTLNYFTKEWVKLGYNIIVIHNRTIYPIIYYWIALIFNKIVEKFMGNHFETKRNSKDYRVMFKNVLIYSMPIYKLIPHRKYQKKAITKHLNKIIEINKLNNFIPDAIIGHFYNPQIELVSKLKLVYQQARTCVVMHESPFLIKRTYSNTYLEYLKNIDKLGFRHKSFKNEFERIYGINYDTYVCYSGVPENYINSCSKDFDNGVRKYCFIGQLIPLKRVGDILDALNTAFPLKNFEFTIVGEGFERKKLENKVQYMGIQSNVRFTGRLKREHVSEILNDADCFVMVSESEAFGLVYLEAMAKGCITIGTRGQGIDGVILHGKNGFLSEANNSNSLAKIFKYISSLPPVQLKNISKKAIDTAKNMTDYKVAENYINTVLDNN
jgi:L-malate glycosyltransferase